MRTSFLSLTAFTLTMSLVGCGGGGGDSSSSTPPAVMPPVVTPPVATTKDFIVEGSSAAGVMPTLGASRNPDGTVVFSGKIGVQRKAGSQPTTTLPPAKLTVRFTNFATGIAYATETASRGTFAAGDSLDGSTTHLGVTYYTYFLNLGFSIPGGTVVGLNIIDNGDGASATGDELEANGYSFWINVPLAPAPNSAPIPFDTINVPGPG